MLSHYFKIKTETERFKDSLTDILFSLREKRVLIYGAGQGFIYLNKKYEITDKLNITAIADKKFVETAYSKFMGLRAISPAEIPNENYDYILVTNERSNCIADYLVSELNIDESKIKRFFEDNYKDECDNVNYLYENKFDEQLSKLIKKMRNKKVMLYGAGAFMSAIHDYFDLSGLNIIGIADRSFYDRNGDMKFLGYKSYSPDKIAELNPDYVLICTKYCVEVAEELQGKYLQGTKIKMKPILRKSFWQLIKEAIR